MNDHRNLRFSEMWRKLTGSLATRRAILSETSKAWREPAQTIFISSTSNCALFLSEAKWSTPSIVGSWIEAETQILAKFSVNAVKITTLKLYMNTTMTPGLGIYWFFYAQGFWCENEFIGYTYFFICRWKTIDKAVENSNGNKVG